MSINIFPDRSQVLNEKSIGGDLRKVLVVPLDFAKQTHVVQIARGTGEYLRKRPLNVHNNMAGMNWLLDKVESCRAKYRIPKRNVIFGGEDPPEYVWNFVSAIGAAGYRFVRVNAKEAKKHRVNSRATSDTLALDGIAQVILLRRAYELQDRSEIYGAMKQAERSRRKLKRDETAVKNRIHRGVDILFPGFLDESLSGLQPFGKASLDLMQDGFSAVRIKRMRLDTLTGRLRKSRVREPERVAAKLKELAAAALPPDPAMLDYLQGSLTAKVAQLRAVAENIRFEEHEMARCLVQTPGFLLTSIPGLGVVLAGGIVAEYGDPDQWPHPDKMASYAGIVARHYQSGGPQSSPVPGRLPIDANHHLKDQLLQAAHHTGQFRHPAWSRLELPGEHQLYENFRRVESREGCSRLSTAKRLLEIGRAMIRDRRVYLPRTALRPEAADAMPPDQHVEYLEIVAEMLTRKWKPYNLSGIPEERNQLRFWLKETEELAKFTKKHNNK